MKQSASGSTLMAVVFLIAVTSLLVAAVFEATTTQARFMKRSVDRVTAIAYADGVLESLFDQWRIAMTDSQHLDATQHTSGLSTSELLTGTPTSPSVSVPPSLPLTLPSSALLPVPPGVSLSAWTVTAANPYLSALASSASRPTPEAGTSSRLRVRIYYLASVKVTFPNGSVTVQRVFTRSGRNIFDNFLYSAQPVTEIQPGAPMYVNGTIYAGGDLYMAQSNLNLQQDVSYTGNKYLNYKGGSATGESSAYWDTRYGNTTPTITSSAWPASDPPHQGSQQKLLDAPTTSFDPHFLDDIISNNSDSDGNPNNDGYHEIIEEVTDPSKPDALQVDSAGTSERLSVNADYRIYVDVNNNVTVYKGAAATALLPTNPEAVAIQAAITTNTAIQDVREGDNVRLVNVDIGAINTAYTGNKIFDTVGSSDGLLLYIKDTSYGTSVSTNGYVVSGNNGNGNGNGNGNKVAKPATVTSSHARGVRLTNGGIIPSIGLSIVSPNAIYIQGDYNTGAAGATTPPSDAAGAYSSSTAPTPTVAPYTRAAAVVAGDSVNILSNAWNDATAALSQSTNTAPPATSTTINTAIVAGNVPTTSSSYSGGIENFPRFHENWGGVYFTIYGSFGLLYDSEQATGTWANALYNPPDRHWYFDSTLQDKNPPGFPVAYSYDRGRWSTP